MPRRADAPDRRHVRAPGPGLRVPCLRDVRLPERGQRPGTARFSRAGARRQNPIEGIEAMVKRAGASRPTGLGRQRLLGPDTTLPAARAGCAPRSASIVPSPARIYCDPAGVPSNRQGWECELVGPKPAVREHVSRKAPAERDTRLYHVVLVIVALAACDSPRVIEFRFSALQSRYFSALASQLKFKVGDGLSTSIRFPHTGPYDHRLGYADLPVFLDRLDAQGYQVRAQARLSPELSRLIAAGYSPPYPEKDQTGFTRARPAASQPCSASAIPSVGIPISALRLPTRCLFIENRELLDTSHRRRNPAISGPGSAELPSARSRTVDDAHFEPGQHARDAARKIPPFARRGAPESVKEKLRQMASASVGLISTGSNTSPHANKSSSTTSTRCRWGHSRASAKSTDSATDSGRGTGATSPR